jgi:hypothetical protein
MLLHTLHEAGVDQVEGSFRTLRPHHELEAQAHHVHAENGEQAWRQL